MNESAILLAAAALAVPAAAQPVPAGSVPVVAPSETVDEEALAAAEELVALMMPDGAMRSIIGSLPGADGMLDLPIAEVSGLDLDGFADPSRTLAEAMEERDPHFRERMRLTQQAINETVAEVVAEAEPEFRRAFAQVYARRFTTAELREMIGFFTTPTGRKFAAAALTMSQDPAYAELMRSMMSRVAASTPQLFERISAATAHLPAPEPDPPTE